MVFSLARTPRTVRQDRGRPHDDGLKNGPASTTAAAAAVALPPLHNARIITTCSAARYQTTESTTVLTARRWNTKPTCESCIINVAKSAAWKKGQTEAEQQVGPSVRGVENVDQFFVFFNPVHILKTVGMAQQTKP